LPPCSNSSARSSQPPRRGFMYAVLRFRRRCHPGFRSPP